MDGCAFLDCLMVPHYANRCVVNETSRPCADNFSPPRTNFFKFGDRLMVGRQVLALVIGVRIPVSEQCFGAGGNPNPGAALMPLNKNNSLINKS